jgi:hypothetical protein
MSKIKERKLTLAASPERAQARDGVQASTPPAIPSRNMAGGRWPVLNFLQP